MVYDPLLELVNCNVPHVQLPSGPGSSRQTPRKTNGFTHANILSRHVALDLQLQHVYHTDIAEKAMELLEKEVREGNKERVDLGGSEGLLDQAEMDRNYSLQSWISKKSYDDNTGMFIEASVEKEVEFFGTGMIQMILQVAVRIAFLITESQALLVEVFKANPSPSDRVIPDTEEKLDLRNLVSLESSLLNPTTGTLRRIQRAKDAIVKLKNFVFTLVEWKFFLSMPTGIFEEIVCDAISQETSPTKTHVNFKWVTCNGIACAEHTEYLAKAKLCFAKHTDDAQVTLEKFNLLDPPSSAMSQSSDSGRSEKSFHDTEHNWQKGKKRQAPGDTEFVPSKEAKKVALMQQLWTQGLYLDQTFLAVSTLNDTILGIRYRAKQSFYISSIQSARQQNPSLPLVLLAHSLCAFNDAVARAQQIPDKDPKGGRGADESNDENPGKDDGSGDSGSGGSDSSGGSGGGGSDGAGPSGKDGGPQPHQSTKKESSSNKRQRVHSSLSGRQATGGLELGNSFGQPFPVVNSLENRARAIDFLSANDTSTFRMSIFHGIYQSEYPAVLKYVLPTQISESSNGPLSTEQYRSSFARYSSDKHPRDMSAQSPLLVLTEPTEQGARGFAYRGFIPYSDVQGCKMHVRVVAKLVAATGDDQMALFHEASVYSSLQNHDIPGIPLVIGLFHDIDDGLYVLVTTDVGLSLSEAAPSKMYDDTSNGLMNTLSAIHDYSWVHSDLHTPNVSQDSVGRFSIFDFDQAEHIAFSDPERVAQECHSVTSLLKSTADDSGYGCSMPILVLIERTELSTDALAWQIVT